MTNIIFDFDGTLVDSFNLIIEITHRLTKHPKLIDNKEISKLRELQITALAQELNIPKYKWPYLLLRGRKLMQTRIDEIKPFQGIDAVLRELSHKNCKVYILSSNSNKNIEFFLNKYGLAKYVNGIYGRVGLFGKARVLAKMIAKHKMNNDETYYIGDELRDIEASKKVHIKIIAVSWGFNSKSVLRSLNPDYIVDQPSEILKIV